MESYCIDLRELKGLTFHQCSCQLVTEADFRSIPLVCKSALEDYNPNFKKHIIHGSFRRLNDLNVQKTGVIKDLTIIKGNGKKKRKERQSVAVEYNADHIGKESASLQE